MEYQTPKTICSLCGSEFTSQGMTRHIKTCLSKCLTVESKGKPQELLYLHVCKKNNLPVRFWQHHGTDGSSNIPLPWSHEGKDSNHRQNAQPIIPCDGCNAKSAVVICTACMWDNAGWLCEACAQTHDCDEDMFLPVVNSPRTGVCGYTGE